MFGTQNETGGELQVASRELRVVEQRLLLTRSDRTNARGFTLTELLIVITIIGILAALTTGAVLRALERAKRAAITLELQNIGDAASGINTLYGSYAPNAITSPNAGPNSQEMNKVRSDVTKFLKKAFPRIDSSELTLVNRLIGSGNNGVLVQGMTASEAVVFWFGGFSKDTSFPISGPGGPSFVVNTSLPGNGEVLENRNWGDGFQFDLGRLGPRDANGAFNGRFIEYQDGKGQDRRINFWTYSPSGSQEPIVYFDTSNVTPFDRVNSYGNYDLQSRIKPHLSDSEAGMVAPIRTPLETVTVSNPTVENTKFVEQGKYQILHCGTDDIWGDFRPLIGSTPILAPEGPFIGDIADTLGNFMTGTLEDKAE